MAEPFEVKVLMKYKKHTPGTFVYEAVEDGAAMKAQYIARSVFEGKEPPEAIEVTAKAVSIK